MKIDKKLLFFVPLAFVVYFLTGMLRAATGGSGVLFDVLMFPASLGIALLDVGSMREAAPAFIFGIDNEILQGLCHFVLTVLQGFIYYGIYRLIVRKRRVASYFVIEKQFFVIVGAVLLAFWSLGLLHAHFGFSGPFKVLMYPCGWFYTRMEAGVDTHQFLSMVMGMDNAVMRGVVMTLLGMLQGTIFYCIYKLIGLLLLHKRQVDVA